jgi:hypothetical protein
LAAGALREALLYHRSQQQLNEQTTINQINRALSQTLDLNQLAEVCRRQLQAWLAPRWLELAQYDEARHEVSFLLAVEDGHGQDLAPRVPEGLLRRVLHEQQPLLLNGDARAIQALGLPQGRGPQPGLPGSSAGEESLGVLRWPSVDGRASARAASAF